MESQVDKEMIEAHARHVDIASLNTRLFFLIEYSGCDSVKAKRIDEKFYFGDLDSAMAARAEFSEELALREHPSGRFRVGDILILRDGVKGQVKWIHFNGSSFYAEDQNTPGVLHFYFSHADVIRVIGSKDRTKQVLKIVPTSLRDANAFVTEYHRHHQKVQGHKFSIGLIDAAADDQELLGVAICGRPVARMMDDGPTVELTRLAVLPQAMNGVSMLTSAVAKAAKAMGYRTLTTYTSESEDGASLLASGWVCKGLRGGGSWSRSTRAREDKHPIGRKKLWVRELTNSSGRALGVA